MIFLFSKWSFGEFFWLVAPVFVHSLAQLKVSRRCSGSTTYGVDVEVRFVVRGGRTRLKIMWASHEVVNYVMWWFSGCAGRFKIFRSHRWEYLTDIHWGVLSMLSDSLNRLLFLHVGSNSVCRTGSLISGARRKIRSLSAIRSRGRFVLRDR